MDYLLFTYPNCEKCEAFRAYLKKTGFEGWELSLVDKESKMKLREYLGQVRRDEKGRIIVPVFVLRQDGQLLGVFQDLGELDAWLKSRA